MKLHNSIFAALALAFVACNNSEPVDPEPTYFTDFATVENITEGGTTLTLRKENDSPLVTLNTKQVMDDKIFAIGNRVVIQYIPASGVQYQTGMVQLVNAVNALGLGAEVPESTSLATSGWQSSQVELYSALRTGNYINIVFQAATAPETAVAELYVDKESLGAEYPELHLVFKPAKGVDESLNVYALYMSYSIADIFAIPTVKGVRLYCADPRLREPIQFDKLTSSMKPIEN